MPKNPQEHKKISSIHSSISPFSEFATSPFDFDGLEIDEGVGNFGAGGSEDPRDRGAVDPHLERDGVLVEFLKIEKPEGLEFIQREDYALKFFCGAASRPEATLAGIAFDPSCFFRSHRSFQLCTYVHNICPAPFRQVSLRCHFDPAWSQTL